jgi:lysyl-tRNA synthetase class 2
VVSDFRPTASLAALQKRAEILRKLRAFFEQRGFLEVETPLLSHDVVVDRHLDPLAATLFDDAREPLVGPKLWLQTSPEFAMKRLLASGATSIYQICKAFRGGGENGARHNPEFTMVEWYRVGDDYSTGRSLLSELANEVLDRGPAEQLTYRAAFARHTGIDPHRATLVQLLSAATERQVLSPADASRFLADEDRDAALDLLLTQTVEPNLGIVRPTILYDYPASQAALARIRQEGVPVAERFELYLDGVELANGYHELLDPTVLRQRNRKNNELRVADGKPALPEGSRLLGAMDHGLPPCSGVALGLDRLVMVALGAKSIVEVLAFPIERA